MGQFDSSFLAWTEPVYLSKSELVAIRNKYQNDEKVAGLVVGLAFGAFFLKAKVIYGALSMVAGGAIGYYGNWENLDDKFQNILDSESVDNGISVRFLIDVTTTITGSTVVKTNIIDVVAA